MFALPGPDVVDLEQEVRVLRGVLREIQHGSRPDQPTRRRRCDVLAVLAGDPVPGRIEVRARVLAGTEVVPVPGRTAFVVAADLFELELRRLPELRRKLQ